MQRAQSTIELFKYIVFSRPVWRLLILMSSLLATALGLAGPFFQKEYMDLLLGKSSLLINIEGPPWILMIFSFFCVLGYLGFSQLTNFLGAREAILMQGELARRLYQQALTLRSDSLEGRPVGEMVAVYATDVSGATFLLEQSLPTGASILFPLTMAPWALHNYFGVPWMTLLLLIGGVGTLNFILAFRQSQYFYQFKKLAADRIGLVNEWIQNIRTLRILGWIKPFEDKIYQMRVRETANRVTMVTNGQAMNSIASSITFVLNIVVILSLVYSSQTPLTAGTLFALLWIVGIFLTKPFRQMPWVFTFILDAWTSIRRLSDFLSLKNDEPQSRRQEFQKIQDLDQNQAIIEVKNLNLKIGSTEILKSIDFSVKKGEFIAIVGEVGSGKTLLLLSLMGETGAHFDQYSLHGNSALELPLNQLRQFFTFVPQEGFIMSATLRDNVAFDYDIPPSEDESILASLQRAQFDLKQERVRDGLGTEIGERGVNLSGGQKQRVSLARVDYFQSPVVLMDDCLSAVDIDTEDRLIKSLLNGNWKNRTRILVTHRLTVLSKVDKIIFIDKGRITATGSFDELLQTNPQFQAFAATVTQPNKPAESNLNSTTVTTSSTPSEGEM